MGEIGAMGLAAIIGAVSAFVLGLMAAIGSAVKYVVTLILDAYKAQARATKEALGREIKAKEERIARIERDRDEQRDVILDQRKVIEDQREVIADLKSRLRSLRVDGDLAPS